MSLTTTYSNVYTRVTSLTDDPMQRANPDVVQTADGGFAVVADRVAAGDLEVRFGVGSSAQVTVILAGQSNGSIARLTGGDYIVVAELGDSVVQTRFSAAGVKLSSNTLSVTEYQDPSVAALKNGGFVVVGTDEIAGGVGANIVARFYSATGGLVRQVTIDPPLTIGLQSNADVTVLNNGNVVFVWSEPRSDGLRQTEYAIYSPIGVEVRPATLFNAVPVSGQDPTVLALPDGGFLVASESAGGAGTTVARYSASGARQDISTIPGTGLGSLSPQLGVQSDGTVVVAVREAGALGRTIVHTLNAQLDLQGTRPAIIGSGEHVLAPRANGTLLLLNAMTADLVEHELTLERHVTGDGAADTWNGDHNRGIVDGGGGNDRLYGGSGIEFLTGGAGDDILSGGDGDDSLTGGIGADILIGGAGSDTANYSRSSAGVMIDLKAGRGYGGDATGDILAEIESVQGSDFNDVMYGAGFRVFLHGGDGNDMLIGGDGQNVLDGDAGDDFLRGNWGNDKLRGGEGFDTVDYSGATGRIDVDLAGGSAADGDGGVDTLTSIERVLGSRFNDVIFGGSANESLYGGLGNDRVGGAVGDDVLSGGDGDDILYGDQGADVLDGGAGRDSAVYDLASSGVTIRLDLGTASDGDSSTDTLISIENVFGSAFNDLIIGDGGDNELHGGGGSDTLIGGGGNDTLVGGFSASTLQGGVGDDRYVVLNGSDTIVEFAGEGVDTVATHAPALVLSENVENGEFVGIGGVVMTGNGLNNILTGSHGDDVLRGRGGNDTLNGGLGTDIADYSLAASAVTVRLDLQRATNDGDGGIDTFTSIEGATGSAFADFMVGGTGNDQLDGGLGADTLLGGTGNDVLTGGAGAANTLQGGAGDDRYIVNANDTIVELAGEGVDTIVTRLNSFTLSANVENLFFDGVGDFFGTGNAGNNQIGGSSGNDIFRGMGGSDSFGGGEGTDEIQFRGTRAEYQIDALIGSYMIVDLVEGRDGTVVVNRVEFARFLGDGVVIALPALDQDPFTPGFQGAPVISDKGDDPLVLPGVNDDGFVDLKGVPDREGPQVQPLMDDTFATQTVRSTDLGAGAEPDVGFDAGPYSGIDVHTLRHEIEGRHGHVWGLDVLV